MRTFILTLITLVAFSAGPALSQTNERADGYASSLAKASSSGSFLVTWVGVQTRINNADAIMAFSSSLDGFNAGEVVISGPWHNGRHVIYATLSSPTRQQIEAALEKARETWAASKAVSQTASPKERIWPLPSAGETVDPDLTRRGPWPKVLEFIEGMKRYKRASYTQEIAVTNDRDRITPVHRTQLENKDWMQPGGMLGIEGYRSDLYRNSVAQNGVESWIGNISVKNSLGYFQENRGWVARYPEGARFWDVLSNTKTGQVFEIRQRLKEEGRWRNSVLFEDEKERPAGYTGLTKSCTSCHSQAGQGNYASGLTPGSDSTLSIGFKALEK